MLKPTPFWDEMGCGGIPREGEGSEIGESGNREIETSGNRKGKTLPLIDTDDTDRKAGTAGTRGHLVSGRETTVIERPVM
jgi:hypothetical protein